jgi:hypothetical protein
LDVCRLFFYAESIEDYETVYALYIHGENWLIPEKEEFLRQIKNDSVSRDNSKKLLNVLKEDIKDVIISKREPGAYIVMNFDKETFFGKTIGFSMVKSKKGLWKVQFLPLQ